MPLPEQLASGEAGPLPLPDALAAGCAIVLVEEPAPADSMLPAPAPATRQLRRRLLAPVMSLARTILRRPHARQLALRVLKRFPVLYARAYRMMMASGTATAPPRAADRDEGDGMLSPRANAILRTLRSLQDGAPRQPGPRPRLAFVAPLPPVRSGIAAYSTELLAELADHFEIELVVAQAKVLLPAGLRHLPVRQAAWFAEHGAAYDQVLYQFGNSPFHSHMFALLERHPGVVVLHDFFLGGALVHAQMSGAAPRAWADALFHSHGYGAVRTSASPEGRAQAHKDWPCSLAVLENATRTIVHSRHARQLASDWFGPDAARGIDVIPHPRTPPPVIDRAAARAALGIAEDTFLVCSFGFIAPNKLTHELLRAWMGSGLHADRQCALVLVGANHDSPYGVEVEALIRGAGAGANIAIAGWTDNAVYRQYLQAADVGVQLRTNAHGESSGAVLDCMNYGLPTIVNANGSMAEFPPDALWRLPDVFTVAELGTALESLRQDAARRSALGRRAVALLDAAFRPQQCARHYLATLAAARAQTQARDADWRAALARACAQAGPGNEGGLRQLAATLAAQETGAQRRLLVDVSDMAPEGGAPDVLAAGQLRALLAQPRPGLRVEPVFLESGAGAPRYREARHAAARLLGLDREAQELQGQPVVDMRSGDIYYAPDAASPSVARAFDEGLFAAWRAQGVRVKLLARTLDQGAAPRAAAGADGLLCVSPAIARALALDPGAATAASPEFPGHPDGL